MNNLSKKMEEKINENNYFLIFNNLNELHLHFKGLKHFQNINDDKYTPKKYPCKIKYINSGWLGYLANSVGLFGSNYDLIFEIVSDKND